MFSTAVANALNHLLAGAAWAPRRLARHGGQRVRLDLTPMVADLRVTEHGFFVRANETHTPPDLTLRLPLGALPQATAGRAALLGAATLSGQAELAETVNLLLRDLRWDIEDDLAQVLGDVVAVRALNMGARFQFAVSASGRRIRDAFGDFFRYEPTPFASPAEMPRLITEIASAQRSADALHARIERLEQRARRPAVRRSV